MISHLVFSIVLKYSLKCVTHNIYIFKMGKVLFFNYQFEPINDGIGNLFVLSLFDASQ